MRGGLSVTPNDPYRLASFRRPQALGGVSKDGLWALNATSLPSLLALRIDVSEAHGLIEPAHTMTLAEYEAALASTRSQWMRVVVDTVGDDQLANRRRLDALERAG